MNIMTENLKYVDVFPDKAGALARRLKIKKDEIPFVRKSYVAEKQETVAKERAVISYISTNTKDRDDEVLLPEGVILSNYTKNPKVLYGHDYRSLPIGNCAWIKPDEKGLIAKTIFAKNEWADQVYQACTEDVGGTGPLLKGWSVGFIPKKWEEPEIKEGKEAEDKDMPKRIYTEWELLEYSVVPIPSCPEALTLAIEKGLLPEGRLKKDLEIEWKKEREVVDREIILSLEKSEEDDEEKTKESEGKKTKTAEEKKITKPETTDNYHHIPIRDKGDFVKTSFRTIDISKEKGIKAVIGKLKSDPNGPTHIQKYLFDKEKWTMEEAQAWVESHKEFSKLGFKEPKQKERWNKSLSKLFDIESAESPIPKPFEFDLFEQYLECKVKKVFKNNFDIPSPLMGTYLAGLKKTLGKFKLKDTRNFYWSGAEIPPQYEIIKLNSKESDDFLISGLNFYDAEGKPLIVKYEPTWDGISVSFITSLDYKDWNKRLFEEVHKWVNENNYLRGEKFALAGDFLTEKKEGWDTLILEEKYKDALRKSSDALEEKRNGMLGRGLLFIGPPGTGKTKTGRILMTNMDTTFIWISSRDFRHIGALRAITLGYSLARDLAPTVLFIEDIDTWLKEYNDRDSVVVDLLKTEMDGLRQNKGILTIMTSNYPEKLPDALLDRPGRFHHIINYRLPSKLQRKKMIELWAGKIEESLLDDIAEKTAGFSGAHMKELVEFASIIADEDEINIGEALLKSLDKLIEQRELIEEIRGNKTGAKSIWNRVKWINGEVEVKIDKEIAIAKRERKEYECECIECGYKMTTDKHCNEISCPECGGEMRRVGRPGPGREYESDDHADLKEEITLLRESITELKEGRVLSAKTRGIIEDAVAGMKAAIPKLEKLLEETDRQQEEEASGERAYMIELDKTDGDKDITARIEEAIDGKLRSIDMKKLLEKATRDGIADAIGYLRGKV